MKRLVVGVMGHVDHGKTALVRALTGIETDRLKEETQRGISIALGFAHFSPAPDVVVDLVDMPGHERFIRTMISGGSGIDAALLVVAANEGLCQQSREHARIAALLGIERALVAVSKCDLVASGIEHQVAEDASKLLESLNITSSASVMTSVAGGRGLDELGQALAVMARSTTPRGTDGLVYLPIDRAFAIVGHGPVVTGTLRGATLRAGDRLELLPSHQEVRVRALQSNGIQVKDGVPGQRLAVNLRDVDMARLGRGMALAAKGSLAPTRWLTLRLHAMGDPAPMRNGMAIHAAFATSAVAGRLRLLDREELHPGQTAMAQVRLDEPAFLPAGEHIVIRSPDLARTLGGGRIVDNIDRRLRRHTPAVLQRLERLSDGSLEDIVAEEIRAAGMTGLPLVRLSQLTGKTPARLTVAVEAAGGTVTREGIALAAGEARRRLALKSRPPQPMPVDDSALEQHLAAAGLTPPTPRELLADPVTAAGINRLLRKGALVRTVDRSKGKEMIFHISAIARAEAILQPMLTQGRGLTVSEIAGALGISRKFAMPLLDHLDTSGFTRRIGDLRVPAA